MKNILQEYFVLRTTFNKEIAKYKLLEKVWGRLGNIPFFENQAINFYRRKHKTILDYLYKEFDVFLSNYSEEKYEEKSETSKKIFTMWIQGIENIPLIVKKTIESQKKYAEKFGYEFIFLDKNNIFNYIQLPEIIVEKYEKGIIDFIKFSDIVRVTLLAKYGGVWLDSTIYIDDTNKLEYFDSEFFTIKSLKGRKKHLLFKFLRDFQIEYFTKFDVAIDYFLIDYLIELAYQKFNSVREAIESNPESNPDLFFLVTNLSKKYDEDEWKRVMQNTSLFKCSYKIKMDMSIGTYFNKIIDQ